MSPVNVSGARSGSWAFLAFCCFIFYFFIGPNSVGCAEFDFPSSRYHLRYPAYGAEQYGPNLIGAVSHPSPSSSVGVHPAQKYQ